MIKLVAAFLVLFTPTLAQADSTRFESCIFSFGGTDSVVTNLNFQTATFKNINGSFIDFKSDVFGFLCNWKPNSQMTIVDAIPGSPNTVRVAVNNCTATIQFGVVRKRFEISGESSCTNGGAGGVDKVIDNGTGGFTVRCSNGTSGTYFFEDSNTICYSSSPSNHNESGCRPISSWSTERTARHICR